MDLIVEVRSTDVIKRTSQRGNEVLKQRMALLVDEDWPLVFVNYVEEALPLGKYKFVPAFRADQYGNLVLDPWQCEFLPLKG